MNNREERPRNTQRPVPPGPRVGQDRGIGLTAFYAGAAMQNQEDAPPCSMCGSIMVRSGSVLQVRELRVDERVRVD